MNAIFLYIPLKFQSFNLYLQQQNITTMENILSFSYYIDKAIEVCENKDFIETLLKMKNEYYKSGYNAKKEVLSDVKLNQMYYLITHAIEDYIPKDEGYCGIEAFRYTSRVFTHGIGTHHDICKKCKYAKVHYENWHGRLYELYSCDGEYILYRNGDYVRCENSEQNEVLLKQRLANVIFKTFDDFIYNKMSLETFNSAIRIEKVSGINKLEQEFINIVFLNIREEYLKSYPLLIKFIKLCNL